MESGSAVVASSRVRLAPDPVRVGSQRPVADSAESKINLVREDGVVRIIELTCVCGEKHRIRCEYA